MQFFDTFLTCYGWEGIALAGAMLAMFGVQLYYYIFVYGRIPGYKNNRRPAVLEADPQVSVVIPLFSEDYSFVEERLPLILAQNYPDFEVVIVYVGHDSDFYEELVRLKQSFPQIVTTKITSTPAFPSRARWRSTWASSRRTTSAWSSLRPMPSPRPTAGWH